MKNKIVGIGIIGIVETSNNQGSRVRHCCFMRALKLYELMDWACFFDETSNE